MRTPRCATALCTNPVFLTPHTFSCEHGHTIQIELPLDLCVDCICMLLLASFDIDGASVSVDR